MAKAKTNESDAPTTKAYTCIYGVFKDGKRIPRGESVSLTNEEAAPLLDEGAIEPMPEGKADAKEGGE